MATLTKKTTRYQMVRVTEYTHHVLQELAAQRGQSLAQVIDQVVERERREQLLRDANAAWARIIADPEALAEIEAEQAAWDTTVSDGLEPEHWSADADAEAW